LEYCIAARLAQHGNSRTAIAESLGISRKTRFNKMREYNLGAEDEDSFS
jgi:DNA-binding NtrC family response regulator